MAVNWWECWKLQSATANYEHQEEEVALLTKTLTYLNAAKTFELAQSIQQLVKLIIPEIVFKII